MAFRNSARNCSLICSVISVFLNKAMSKLLMPPARMVGSVRDSLPNPNDEGAEKQDVLNHWVILACEVASGTLPQPAVTLGRGVPAPKFVLSDVGCAVRAIGKPFCIVVVPFSPQPETSFPSTPRALLRKRFPL